MSQELLEDIVKRGYRLTAVRSFIVNFLATHKKPYDALLIKKSLEKAVKKVNKTTVYREIEFLLSLGVIRIVDFGDGKKRYEISGLPHHHHLICKKCDSIEDVVLEKDLESIERKIAKLSRFRIESHALEFFGLCSRCA